MNKSILVQLFAPVAVTCKAGHIPDPTHLASADFLLFFSVCPPTLASELRPPAQWPMQVFNRYSPASVGDTYAPKRSPMDRSRLSAALDVVGSLSDVSLPLHQIALLLYVGEHGPGGCTYAAIEARLGISNAAASRSVNSLSASARHRKTEPMGLVEKIIDPEEGRRYKVRLTKKGLTLMRALDQL